MHFIVCNFQTENNLQLSRGSNTTYPSVTYKMNRTGDVGKTLKSSGTFEESAVLLPLRSQCAYTRDEKYAGTSIPGQRALIRTINTKAKCFPPHPAEETAKNVRVEQYGPRTLQSHRAVFPQSEAIRKNPGTPEGSKRPSSEGFHDSRRAPLTLFAEFLKSVMERKYILARKLCQMILIYEPENPEAKQFIPLIEAKLLMEPEEDQEEEDIGLHTSDSDTENEGGSLEPSNCTCSDDLEEEVEASS
ncbi:glutamate-rich protein 2 isoform X2 [Brienomyrus brachyistius]|uniref:glutamate-rich protein 2 isoform X2 n=1 Tax=Brienomyrus brachyistius TaxID=42636 RepID=UPI0020B1DD86|nr:glutamate-rich protein 2 isoform X2 [Brienomyrus brachyistius]